MNDYILLPRSALSEDLWRDKDLWQLYGYLLSKADENGVIDTSLATMQRELRVNQKPLRTMLAKLERANKAARQRTSNWSKITICDFANYAARGASNGSRQGANKKASPSPSQTTIPEVAQTPSFVAPEFAETWRRFVEYRKEIRKPYKSESSERTAYNKMVEMANNDPAAAKDMVERTILGQWQGLFPRENHGTKPTATDNAVTHKERRDQGLCLAGTIISESENLFNLYNGCGQNPDDSQN